MNIFRTVKESVTTRQAAETYGFKPDRRGMVQCPFHDDRRPSMKVDRRFYCFGCGAKGDVIDFTARLFGLNVKETAIRLVNDFSIPNGEILKGNVKNRKPPPVRKSMEKQFVEIQKDCFCILADYRQLLIKWKETYAPRFPEETWHPRFEESLKNISKVEYFMDVLLYGSLKERVSLICDYGKKVRLLERRMAGFATPDAAGCEECDRRHSTAKICRRSEK